MHRSTKFKTWGWVIGATALLTSGVQAASVSLSGTDTEDGLTISGTADFTLDAVADTVTIKLTNTTPFTKSAAQLLTKLTFTLDSLTTGSLASGSADGIDISGTGSVSSAGTGDLVALNTWSLTDGGTFELVFNPDAKWSIIGLPEADGTYKSSNGSIKGNPGHNPFADQMATFVIDVPGLLPGTTVGNVDMYFGTAFQSHLVPLPAAAWLGMAMLGGLGVVRKVRRRAMA